VSVLQKLVFWGSSLRPPFDRSWWLIQYPDIQEKSTTCESSLGSIPQLDNLDLFDIHLNLSIIGMVMWSQKWSQMVTIGYKQLEGNQFTHKHDEDCSLCFN
jgi:hypothetical protein